jgi:Mrp family chromosome partitioning ATPase
MGEISEALKRARLERENRADTTRTAVLTQVPDLDRLEPPEPPAFEPTPAIAARPEPEAAPRVRCEISRVATGDWTARAVLVEPHGAATERFRQFALRVRRRLEQRHQSTVLVTSALHGEGKTTVACNLALALASMSNGGRVALVDLDLRRPSVSHRLGVAPRALVPQVLAGEAPLDAARVDTEFVSFDVYANDASIHDSHVLLAGAPLRELVGSLVDRYETVVFDGPPVLLLSDAALILECVESCVAVARRGVTRMAALREALEHLPADKLLGEFLNEAVLSRHTYGYYQHPAGSGTEAS